MSYKVVVAHNPMDLQEKLDEMIANRGELFQIVGYGNSFAVIYEEYQIPNYQDITDRVAAKIEDGERLQAEKIRGRELDAED